MDGRTAAVLQTVVAADLQRAARLLIKIQKAIDPQIRMATPEGDYHVAVKLRSDGKARQDVMDRIGLFMAWRQVIAFTWTYEIAEPDGLVGIGIARNETISCVAEFNRTPRPWTLSNFGPLQWLESGPVDPALTKLLPRGIRQVLPDDLKMLDEWFGPKGRFPAVHIASGEFLNI